MIGFAVNVLRMLRIRAIHYMSRINNRYVPIVVFQTVVPFDSRNSTLCWSNMSIELLYN